MEVKYILCFLVSLAIGLILAYPTILLCRKLKIGQTTLHYVEEHKGKSGTPTMGGVIFILSSIVGGCIFFSSQNLNAWLCFLVMLGYGLLGFLDDFIKVKFHQNEGLKPYQKIIGQMGLALIMSIYVYLKVGTSISFFGLNLNLSYFIIPFVILVYLATTNSVNLTDGLDGLATSVTSVIAVFFTVAGALYGFVGISAISAVMLGALLGFLVFNCHPAKVFMGDTGSLMLGGYTAAAAIVLRQPFIIIIVAFIYLIEVVSVIIQVLVFKATHGQRRFFRMAPIHHHFELGGWEETKVVTMFTLVTTVLMMVGFIAL